MSIRTLAVVGLLCLGTAGGFAYTPPVQAGASVDVDVNVAPPAPRFERVEERRGYAWSPGYWRWNHEGRRHEWQGGVYVADRDGYVWVPHHWSQGPRGGWHFDEGHWNRR